MFYKSGEYELKIGEQYTDKITSLTSSGTRIFIGREDGRLESIGGSCQWEFSVFQKEYDLLENDVVGEQIIAIEHMTDGGICDLFYLANEKSLAIFQVRNDQSTIGICRSDPAQNVRIVKNKKCPNVHSYLVNSLTLNLSKNVLVSSDFLKINMWSPAHMDKCYNILDLKPSLGQEDNISSVINATKFSPFSDNLLAWASSNGKINIHDIEISPKSQCVATIDGTHHFNVKSISDISFVNSNQIISRSVNNIFLSDLRNPYKPVFSKDLIVNSYLLAMMDSLKANYLTFKISNDGLFAYTGSCFESIYVINLLNGDIEEVEVGKRNNLSVEKSIKHVIPENNGFCCAFDSKLHYFKRKIE